MGSSRLKVLEETSRTVGEANLPVFEANRIRGPASASLLIFHPSHPTISLAPLSKSPIAVDSSIIILTVMPAPLNESFHRTQAQHTDVCS